MEWALTDFYILDSAMGTELAYRGYDLPDWKESIWSAKALNDGQDLIRSIHEDNITAGCNVITTSNYYATPLILNGMGKKYNYLELTKIAIQLAQKAVDSKNKNVMIAGSFPPINISFRPDLIPSNNQLIDFYSSISELYTNNVDLILCETISSIQEAQIASKIALENFHRVWLSWTVRGIDFKLLPSKELLSDAVKNLSKTKIEYQLVNCAHADLTTEAIKILKEHTDNFGAYANSSIYDPSKDSLENYESVDEIHHHHSNEINCSDYLKHVKDWIGLGAKVVGGCCTTRPEHIKEISENT